MLIKKIFAKNPYEPKNPLLINQYKQTVLKHFNNPKALIENSNEMNMFREISVIVVKMKNIQWYDHKYDKWWQNLNQ